MIRSSRTTTSARRARTVALAGLAASALVVGGAADPAGAQVRPNSPFWDVGVAPMTGLVDGQEVKAWATAEDGTSFFAHQCSAAFDTEEVVCENLGGPVQADDDGFIRFTVNVKAVIADNTDTWDCTRKNTCTLVILPQRMTEHAWSTPLTFVPAAPEPSTTTTTAAPSTDTAQPKAVKAQPRYTG